MDNKHRNRQKSPSHRKMKSESGIKNNPEKYQPQTPLNMAVMNGNLDSVLELLMSGANPAEKDGHFGNSSMHWAVKSDNVEAMELFKRCGVDLSLKENSGWTPLHLAAERGYSRSLLWLLNNGAPVDAEDSINQTPLFKAVIKGRVEIAKLLFEKGANLNHTDKRSKSALHCAESLPMLEWLLENNLDINGKDEWGRTPLHHAVNNSNLEKARFLLEKGADIEVRDKNNHSPLHMAAKTGKNEFIRLFLNNGADPIGKASVSTESRISTGIGLCDKSFSKSVSDLMSLSKMNEVLQVNTSKERNPDTGNNNAKHSPQTPLYIAVLNGNIDTVTQLLISGANPQEKDGYYGNSGMHWAAKADSIELLELFKGLGLGLATKNNLNWTPLHFAAEGSRCKSLVWLLNNGAPVDSEDSIRQTPLFRAVIRGHIEVAKMLIGRGANMKHTDNRGKSVLHCAESLPMIQWLLKNNLDINGKDEWGRTPLHHAVKTLNLEKARFLVENGANIEARDKYGHTPLHMAAKTGKNEFIRLLLNKGASPVKQVNEVLITKSNESSVPSPSRSIGTTSLKQRREKEAENRKHASNQHNSETEKNTAINLLQKSLNVAILDGNIDKVIKLLNLGANPKETDGHYGNTGMHWAVKADNIEILQLLKQRGSDVLVKNNFNWTPLHIAADESRYKSLVWLLNNGALVDSVDSTGQTPLVKAVLKGDIKIARILIERGADLKYIDSWGKNLLHHAASLPMMEWLLEQGLDINRRDDLGRTVLHDAVQASNLEKARFLLLKGANLDIQDRNGSTPLYEAAQSGRGDFIKLFLKWRTNTGYFP